MEPNLSRSRSIPRTTRLLQTLLAGLGLYAGRVDGEYGRQTEGAVLDFQKSNGLADDGMVGEKTWTALGIDAPKVKKAAAPKTEVPAEPAKKAAASTRKPTKKKAAAKKATAKPKKT